MATKTKAPKLVYFADCQTAEDLKKAFHKMAVKLHPDNGGKKGDF